MRPATTTEQLCATEGDEPLSIGQVRRKQLLDEVLARPHPETDPCGPFDPELVSRIVGGLVFANRPIKVASQSVNDMFNLGPRGAFMLSLIENGVQYPNDLSTVLGIRPSLVTAELARLTEAGLVSSEAGEDRRRTRLSLTALGRRTNKAFRADLVARIERSLVGYSPEQVSLFATMLLRFRDQHTV